MDASCKELVELCVGSYAAPMTRQIAPDSPTAAAALRVGALILARNFPEPESVGGKLPSEVDLQRVAEYAAELLWRFEREYAKRPRE